MSSMREIKTRITATQKTSQITKAMNMVSAAKLRKTEKKYRAFQPIRHKIESILEDILSTTPDLDHPLLKVRPVHKTGYILIASDRGLAGPYNNNVFKAFQKHVSEHHQSKEEFIVGTVGYKAFAFCKRNKYQIINSESVNSRDEVQFIDFQAMSRTFINDFLLGIVDEIVVFHSHYVNTLTQNVQFETLLPITTLQKDPGHLLSQYLFEPSADAIIDKLLPIYLDNTLYGIILDAKTSEHASRMTAMKNATDNAKDVIGKLRLHYNRARQSAITIELTDIIGGANAVN